MTWAQIIRAAHKIKAAEIKKQREFEAWKREQVRQASRWHRWRT